MNERDLIDRLREAEWPSPSPECRARVSAITVPPQPILWADRLWYSRPWRLGMAAAAVAVVAVNLWPGRSTDTLVPDPPATRRMTELVQSAGLPEDAAAMIARRARITSHTDAQRMLWLPGDNQ